MKIQEKIERSVNNIRLFFLYNFYKSYLIRKTIERLGECKKCGACCKGCPYLNKDNKCRVYNNRPKWCHKDMPVDEFDLKVNTPKGKCRYYWGKKNWKS